MKSVYIHIYHPLLVIILFLNLSASDLPPEVCACLKYTREDIVNYSAEELHGKLDSCTIKLDKISVAANISRTPLYQNIRLYLISDSSETSKSIMNDMFRLQENYNKLIRISGKGDCYLFNNERGNHGFGLWAIATFACGIPLVLIGNNHKDDSNAGFPVLWPKILLLKGYVLLGVTVPFGIIDIARHKVRTDRRNSFFKYMGVCGDKEENR